MIMKKNNQVKLSSSRLREIFLDAGADDVGFVEIGRPALKDSKAAILELFPDTKTLVSVVVSLNRPNLCTPARNLTSYELHNGQDVLGELQWRVLRILKTILSLAGGVSLKNISVTKSYTKGVILCFHS